MVRGPLGSYAWHHGQYVMGLARLGHDVYYHEDTWNWPYHPIEKRNTSDGSYSAKYINDFFEKYANIQYIYFQNNSKEKLELIMDKVFIDDIFINKYLRIKYQTWNLPKERKV